MANYEATRYDWDGEYLTNVQGINTGLIIPWGAASIPSGFLECNGQSVSTATYAALFAVIGYTYGGAGASFLLPDLTDRTVVNKSNTKNLAQTGGANTVAKTGNVSGTVGNTTLTTAEMPAHTHMATFGTFGSGSGGMGFMDDGSINGVNSVTSGSTGGDGAHDHTVTANFTGSADSVLQPYIVMVYIIKT
jgi:microcystin-dependent protein